MTKPSILSQLPSFKTWRFERDGHSSRQLIDLRPHHDCLKSHMQSCSLLSLPRSPQFPRISGPQAKQPRQRPQNWTQQRAFVTSQLARIERHFQNYPTNSQLYLTNTNQKMENQDNPVTVKREVESPGLEELPPEKKQRMETETHQSEPEPEPEPELKPESELSRCAELSRSPTLSLLALVWS